ncbi:MAG: hypothetical protein RJQ08_14100 [Salinisphaeraceae bacterium]
MQAKHLVLHGIAIKKHATVDEVAGITGLDRDAVQQIVDDAVATGRVQQAGDKMMLAPAAQMALTGEYRKAFSGLREDDGFLAAYQDFEKVNVDLKQVITEWQTMTVGGEQVPNDHSDSEYDDAVIDKLGDVHERVEGVLDRLSAKLPRLSIYKDKLLAALEKAEDGDTAWVSDARTESYHTVWFELHEDLLRITGNKRSE